MDEESFKTAVFNKVRKVNHLINDITIGPNSTGKLKTNENPSPKQFTSQTSQNNVKSSPINERGIPKRQFLKLLDLDRQAKVQSAIQERLNRFKEFNGAQEEQQKQSWLKTQQTFIQDLERQEKYIIEANQQYDLKQSSQHAKMAQLTQNAMLRMKQRQELLREKERQKQILSEHINKIKINQQKFSTEFQQILVLFKTCTDSTELKACKDLDLSLLKTLPAEIECILEKCKDDNFSDITNEDVQKSEEVIMKIIDFKQKFKAAIDFINNKKQQAAKAIDNSNKQTEVSSQPVININSAKTDEIKPQNVMKVNKNGGNNDKILNNLNILRKYVCINDLNAYTELIGFHQEYKKNFIQLESDESLKNFKFDCKKAINIPVNSLSGVNSEHIMDKYRKLHTLLTGQSVTISDKNIVATRHPQGIPFCMDLLARKFVSQGDLMVSSNPESAFCYASVILSLWNDFPDFGKLLLAYFYEMCPYLVPYYIPKQVGETDEEFYKKLGYQYSDGEVEKQDKFLKRMTGIMKLYFALMIAKPRRGQNTSPYCIKHGWKWLASFLRLEPQLDITATALHVFLETVGFEMDAKYGKMFQKILNIILQVFLPKCKEVKCTGGAVTRLELLLTNYLKNRKFEKPNGYVEYSYW